MNTQIVKRKLSVYDLPLIIVNLIPVTGVWFFKWEPAGIFIVYALETILAGIFAILRMGTAIFFRKGSKPFTGISAEVFYIFFFILHYGLFIAIQMGMFMALSRTRGADDFGLLGFFRQIPLLLNEKVAWTLAAFAIIYIYNFFRHFILTGEYKTASTEFLMFQPYIRIFIQQVTVIAGGMFMTLGAARLFILVFIAVKLYVELRFDYDAMLRSVPLQEMSKSGKQ